MRHFLAWVFSILMLCSIFYFSREREQVIFQLAIQERDAEIARYVVDGVDMELIKLTMMDVFDWPEPMARIRSFTVKSFCSDFRMDTLWALPVAITWQESFYNNLVESDSGAKGAGQFLDWTFDNIMNQYDTQWMGDIDIWNRELQTFATVAYLYKGLGDSVDISHAVMSYFAGYGHKKYKRESIREYYREVMIKYNYLREVYERIKTEKGS